MRVRRKSIVRAGPFCYHKTMIQVETKVRLPFLWGKAAFTKRTWAQVNLIVGPNGSGKTLLAQSLALQLRDAGIPVKFLRSERAEQDGTLSALRSDSAIRGKIEAVLSGMFGKSIRFEETDGGFVPMVTNKARGVEYNLKDGECHGLKEILTLLVTLYSTRDGCIIFDEPELHLHPQLQLFFMSEIRRAASESPGRIFFLITHSPFFIDLRFPEDLSGVVVCHINRAPTHIESLGKEDESLFRRFLPRFNTYHKQFFFSDNQIFVEGYTDQQMFASLMSLTSSWYSAAGTGIIDVGGKDELGVFCKVCSLLGTDGRIICDLDALFQGKLRDVICSDPRPALWLEKQAEKQLPFYRSVFSAAMIRDGITMQDLLSRLEQYLVKIGNALGANGAASSPDAPPEILLLSEKIRGLADRYENVEDIDTFKTVVLQGVTGLGDSLGAFLPLPLAAALPLVRNLSAVISAAAEAARVYILPRGCIEHYYTQNSVQYMPVAAKDRLFHTEHEHMSTTPPETLRDEYAELIAILERACARSA